MNAPTSSPYRRLLIIFSFLLLVVLLGTGLLLVSHVGSPDEEYPAFGNNLIVFSLVNFNIVLLCVLIFVVGRNCVRLLFEWRRNIFGAKLRAKLMLVLVGLVLVPTSLLFFLASGLLTSAMEGWLSTGSQKNREAALLVAKEHYAKIETDLLRHLRFVGEEFDYAAPAARGERLLNRYRRLSGLMSLTLFSPSGEPLSAVRSPLIRETQSAVLDESAFAESLRKGEAVSGRSTGDDSRVVGYHHREGVVVEGVALLPPEIQDAFIQIDESYSEYEELRLFRAPLRSGYLLSFAMVTGMILFGAVWVAFYLARQILVPIERLALGTREIARGNYDILVPETGGSELTQLVSSFNTMARDLKVSREESERRRLLIEVILKNLGIGVIVVTGEGRVVIMNRAAQQLLEVGEEPLGVRLDEVLSREEHGGLLALLEGEEFDGDEIAPPRQIRISQAGRELDIMVTGGPIREDDGGRGTVLLLDDITELSKAQHMAAWREVARRIAHEIKNPLTPLQLSAQRILRLLPPDGDLRVRESAETIVEHVDSIKVLADEFSRFARMPTAQVRENSLQTLIAEVLQPYAERDNEIVFQAITEPDLPPIGFDYEQIRRVLINLLDNAVEAIQERARETSAAPRIAVSARLDRKRRNVILEVSDNGPGLPASAKGRIFEPYFTSKKQGTGLGLAIVTSILADHQGTIRVFDNRPQGARFRIEFPIQPRERLPQRRFSGQDPGA